MNGLIKSKLEFYKNSITESGIDKVNYLEILKEYDLSELGKKPDYAGFYLSINFRIKLIDNLRISKK